MSECYELKGSKTLVCVSLHVPKVCLRHDSIRSNIATHNVLSAVHQYGHSKLSMISLQEVYRVITTNLELSLLYTASAHLISLFYYS